MTATATFFVIVGVSVASAGLMRLVEWLDTPRRTHRAATALHSADLPCAELELESARLAA